MEVGPHGIRATLPPRKMMGKKVDRSFITILSCNGKVICMSTAWCVVCTQVKDEMRKKVDRSFITILSCNGKVICMPDVWCVVCTQVKDEKEGASGEEAGQRKQYCKKKNIPKKMADW